MDTSSSFLSTLALGLIAMIIPLTIAASASKAAFENRGLVPFFLQDPTDGLCLGLAGFTICDTNSLWVMAGRKDEYSFINLLNPDENQMCLEREKGGKPGGKVVGGSCRNKGSKNWLIEGPNSAGYYRVSDKSGDLCLTRYKGGGDKDAKDGSARVRSSMNMQKCNPSKKKRKGEESGYVQLNLIETAVHDAGFFLESADGKCFDGNKFVKCDSGSSSVLWGIGFSFDGKGRAHRSIFKYKQPDQCLTISGDTVKLAPCSSKNVMGWGLDSTGRLSFDNERKCLVRTTSNLGGIRKCTEHFEHISVSIPREADEALKKRQEYDQMLVSQQQQQLAVEQNSRNKYQEALSAKGYY